jgi:hypothetical protein
MAAIHLQRYDRHKKVAGGDCGKLGDATNSPDAVTCGLCLLRIYTGTVRPYWRGKLAGRKGFTWSEHLNKNIVLNLTFMDARQHG